MQNYRYPYKKELKMIVIDYEFYVGKGINLPRSLS